MTVLVHDGIGCGWPPSAPASQGKLVLPKEASGMLSLTRMREAPSFQGLICWGIPAAALIVRAVMKGISQFRPMPAGSP